MQIRKYLVMGLLVLLALFGLTLGLPANTSNTILANQAYQTKSISTLVTRKHIVNHGGKHVYAAKRETLTSKADIYATVVTETAAIPSPTQYDLNWAYFGCFSDNTQTRVLTTRPGIFSEATTLTVESCLNICQSKGFLYAGVEFGQECWCDHILRTGAGFMLDPSGCNMPCSGKHVEMCGGRDRIGLYINQNSILLSDWAYFGCFTDSIKARVLATRAGVPAEATSLDIESCLATCQSKGFLYAGVEFGQECWCDDTLHTNIGFGLDQLGCNRPCVGKVGEMCGGRDRIGLYIYQGFPSLSSTGSGSVIATIFATASSGSTGLILTTSMSSKTSATSTTTSPPETASQNTGLSSTPSCSSTYTVVRGDACYSIWTKSGLSQAQFLAMNPKLSWPDCPIYPGDILCLQQRLLTSVFDAEISPSSMTPTGLSPSLTTTDYNTRTIFKTTVVTAYLAATTARYVPVLINTSS